MTNAPAQQRIGLVLTAQEQSWYNTFVIMTQSIFDPALHAPDPIVQVLQEHLNVTVENNDIESLDVESMSHFSC